MPKQEHIERAYRFLVALGHAMLEAPGELELAEALCRVAVENAGYRLAWIGYLEHAPPYRIRPVAHAGYDDGYIDQVEITWKDGPRAGGPTGHAAREGVPQVVQSIATDEQFTPWRDNALARGYASSAAIPLMDGGEPWAVLNVYAVEPDAFDTDELELLETACADATHGLLAARGRFRLARLQAGLALRDRHEAIARSAALHAHDVNNHLAVLRLCLSELKQPGVIAPPEVIADAELALEKAIALNAELLDRGRALDDATAILTVDATLADSRPELERLLGDAGTLEVGLHADGARVHLSDESFRRIVTNLVSNAAFALKKPGKVCLETRTVDLEHPLPSRWLGGNPGRYVSLRSRDTGEGMAPEVRERIFEPFFSTKKEKGSGLGLASVYNTVISQGRGLIAVDSAPGEGTTIEILLPIVDDAA